MRIAVPDTTLYVAEFGSGRPVVLVHGGTGTGAFDWTPVLPALAERFRVVTVDLRGHGGSAAPGWRLGIHRYGLDIAHVMRSLGIPRAGLVGFSAGANSILTLVTRRPDMAAGVIVVGASMASDPSRIDELLSGPWPSNLKAIEHDAAVGPEHWRRLREALARDWVANNTFAPEELARISVPTLVIHGTRDRTVPPEQAELLAAAIPDASIWYAEGARHMVQHDQPEAFAEHVIDFLESVRW